ncbi:MAG: ComEC/Rec2 family competence protein [Patescibacteria group bacterium]
MQHSSFIIGVVCFTLGIAVAFLLDFAPALLVLIIGIIFLGGYQYYQNKLNISLLVIWTLVALFGFLRTLILIDSHQVHPLDVKIGSDVVFEAIVVREREVREQYVQLVASPIGFDTQILLRVNHYPEIRYGDRIQISGMLDSPEGFRGEDGRYFDYKNYLLQLGIRYEMNFPDVVFIEGGQGNFVMHILLDIKQSFVNALKAHLSEPHASLASGLLVGAKEAMGERLLIDFRNTGIIHIVVLSGYNISLVAGFFMYILGYLNTRVAAVIGSLAILFFALMTGAGATVVRASLMAFLVIIARLTGNYAEVIRMLFLAAFLMLLYNPMLLLYSPSFQLSFVATYGLIILAPYIERWFVWVPNPKGAPIRELISATVATQIMVLPLILYMMGDFATYAPLVNFLVLASVPYAMMSSFALGVVSMFVPAFASLFSIPAFILLEYELIVVDFFARMPGVVFQIPPFSFVWVAVAYLLYLIVAWYYIPRNRFIFTHFNLHNFIFTKK